MKVSLIDQVTTSPLFWVSAAMLTGIVLASVFNLPPMMWFGLTFIALLLALLVRRMRPGVAFSLLLLPGFIFIGAARYQIAQPVVTQDSINYYNDLNQRVYVSGILAEPPDVRDTYANLRIQTDAIDLGQGDIPIHGVILVRLTNEYDVAYGDHVRVRGFVKTPVSSEEFSYRDYLATQGIGSTLQTSSVTVILGKSIDPFWAFTYRIKDSLTKSLYRLFPDPEASLLAGILLGSSKTIPGGVQQAFQNTGTAHIIAISGFNIAILAAVILSLLSRAMGKRWGAIAAIGVIIFYTLLVGASASVVRAAIMGTMAVIAGQFGRRNMALTTLATAALLMALINPFVLWDVGFQLSFAATLGMVLYAQPMQDAASVFLAKYIPAATVDRFISPFSEYFLLTLVAQLTTLPIMIYHFGQLSLVSILANPVVLPAQPAVMILSGLALFISRIYFPLGQLFAWIAWPFAAYTVRMVEFFGSFPGGTIALGQFSLITAIVFYVLLFGITLAWGKIRGVFTPSLALALLAAFTFLTWRSVFNLPDGNLHMIFLNSGSSDGILVETPSGHYVLINGGTSPSSLADELGRRIPPFSKGIDTLVIASTQENEVGSLPRVTAQYPPRQVLWAGNPQASFSSQRLTETLTSNLVPTERLKKGAVYDMGGGAMLRVLAISPRGAVLSIEMGNFKAVLPMGINFDVLSELQNGRGLGPATVLLVADSGYAPSNPAEWLTNIDPQVSILNVAAGDPNGLPALDVLKFFEGKNLLRTDITGWVDIASDGHQFWVTSEQK